MRTAWRVILLSLLLGLWGITTSYSQIFGRNYKPYIFGQNPLSVEQGKSITIQFSDLKVLDLDNPYPQGFTMELYDGKNYEIDETTVIPDPDFFGTLKVPVTVNDGEDNSNQFELKISVIEAPNVPPTITGQVPLTIIQGESITLQLEYLTVSDPDNNYPEDFSLSVYPGQNYTVSGRRVTPFPAFTGTLTVAVRVSDGESQSEPYNLKITVRPKNAAPVITGQSPLTTKHNTPITILLSHLIVSDPDNDYPEDFTLKVRPGTNYKVSGTTVTPTNNFVGNLNVGVTVNDGAAESEVFILKISVLPPNVPPVITGQVPLTTKEETALTILLAHLKVTDPDNKYPDDFTLQLFPGSNYSLSGTTITPVLNFTGVLQVGVRVSDGKATSNTYSLQVTVTPVNDLPVITGQVQLSMNEDTSLALLLAHLTVSDPDNAYPNGFTLQILPGPDYTANQNVITPVHNFNGSIQVSIVVNDGIANSKPFNLIITVNPLSDPPEIKNLETQPGTFHLGKGLVPLSEKVEVIDPEGDSITYAEVGFVENNYRQGSDILFYDNSKTSAIDGVFDASRGLLFLFGTASANDYTNAIRAIKYNYVNEEENPVIDSLKMIYLYVKDGQLKSETKMRTLTMISRISLHIPNCFTPNGDEVNDTWQIRSTNTSDDYKDALIRVYNIRGLMVYEATGLDKEWDGKHNGTTLPSDTYYFTINLNLTYTRATYKGIVTILH